MLKGTIRHTIGATALTAMLLLLCVSCSDDAISTASITSGDDGSVVVGLTLSASYGYDENGYETGTDYENYINIADDDYRIYFFTNKAADDDTFDGNDTFIAKFTPESVIPVEGSNYTQYDVQGVVPEALLQYTTFKVMMLANWGNYEDENFSSTTTIDDICSVKAEWATYNHKDNFELGPSNLIPFYGINTYSNVDFKKGEFTKLDGDLTLLRAMAKVEVTFDSDLLAAELGTVFTDVKVFRYNDKGYCAPEKAYTKTSYDHSYNYDTDFAEEIHLVGTKYEDGIGTIQYDGFNDYDEDGNPIERSLTFKSNDDGTMWYAYLPEYDNDSYNADDFAYIEVKFIFRNYEEGPYRIYFADYNEGTGTTDNSIVANRFDIKRNNLYRFTIVDLVQYFRVHVDKWTNEWTNDFYYDSSDDL